MIFHMRLAITGRLAGDAPIAAMLALGEATASQIANAFFAICEEIGSLDDEEKKIARRLARSVNDEIKRRNDFTHGDWWVGFGRKPSGALGDPALWRVKPTRRAGRIQERDFPIGELDELSDGLHALRQHVTEFGEICLQQARMEFIGYRAGIRVRDIFVLRDNQVVREGPEAPKKRMTYT
jgi:hypothetical protein